MSMIGEFTKIMAAGRRQYRDAKGKPLLLVEEHGTSENMVCCGDNKAVMKALLDEHHLAGKVQMIYIDPPFFSRADYDAVVKAGDANIRHRAYGDKWSKGLSEYLKMLTGRLYLMRDLLAEDGLIWLHLDWHAVHYARIIMDEVFGEKNFVNEIIWNYKSGGTSKKHFARKHDTILVYSKTGKYRFYPQQEKSYNRQFKPYRFKGVQEYQDDMGWYTMVNMKDVWNIDMVGRTSAERTGYATQKPEALLERIIESSTRAGDLCADFFCGSGTLPAVANRMGRRFIACDQGALAVESTISRLDGENAGFSVYTQRRALRSKLSATIDVQEECLPESEQKLLRISLRSIGKTELSQAADEKSRTAAQQVLRENSLQLVAAWSIDTDYRDGVFRPEVIFRREKGQLTTTWEKCLTTRRPMCIKVVDIFGNVELIKC